MQTLLFYQLSNLFIGPFSSFYLECKFKCDNGRCLFDRGMVCNRKNDCGDNSDETRLCGKYFCSPEFQIQFTWLVHSQIIYWNLIVIMVSKKSLSKYRYMQKLLICCVSTEISVNCTFDDNYLCGYNASGFIWSYGASNSQAQSSLPWTDHTIGHYPGKNISR